MTDDLTRFQYDLLAALHTHGRMHGLGIKSHLETEYDYGEVNHARLYPNLDTLVERGLVGKSELDGRTNEYDITDAGMERVRGRVALLAGGERE